MKEQRRSEIESYIKEHGNATMKELQYRFGVSMNTLRSDIDFLAEAGNISKVYGGVQYVTQHSSFEYRIIRYTNEKLRIARKAADLIEDGDVIYLDYGTTTPGIIDFLSNRKNVSIITANMYAIQKCLQYSNLSLFVLPGEFDIGIYGLISENTNTDLKNYSFNKAFMSCCGILSDGRICVSRFLQQKEKQNVMSQSKMKYLLTYSSKFQEIRMLNYSVLSDFNILITDNNLNNEQRLLCKYCRTEVLVV